MYINDFLSVDLFVFLRFSPSTKFSCVCKSVYCRILYWLQYLSTFVCLSVWLALCLASVCFALLFVYLCRCSFVCLSENLSIYYVSPPFMVLRRAFLFYENNIWVRRGNRTRSGSTICFLPSGALDRIPRMHPHLQWNRVLLLVMSRCIGDPDMVQSLALFLFSGHFTRLRTNHVKR